jgi:DNA-binding protein WhiA
MSFASETKNELSRVMPEKRCCMLAEIAGFIRVAGSVSLAGGGKFRIILTTDNPAVARHYKKMLKEYFKIETETSIGQGSGISRGKKYFFPSPVSMCRSNNVRVLVAQSCPTLCSPIDDSPLGSSVHAIPSSSKQTIK